MRNAKCGCIVGAGLLMSLGSTLPATELTVGPGKAYSHIEDALSEAVPNDVIIVYPQAGHRPYEKVALAVDIPLLSIKAAPGGGARIRLSGEGGDYSGRGPIPRAIVQFNKGADGCLFEGFELSGAHNESHNGAGVRINQANDVTIRSCSIHDNDMGIMSNGDGTPHAARHQLIENCLIYGNGDLGDPGRNHNLYLGGTSVTLRGCEVHSSLTGHNIKSRAHRTFVTACYIHDSANRELDLVDARGDTTAKGSHAVLAGNIIVKDRHCRGNRAVIHFGQDGGNGHDGTLYLVHNTIVTPFISPVVHLSAPRAQTRLFNNIIWDGGTHREGQVLVLAKRHVINGSARGSCNWMSSGFQPSALAAPSLQQTRFGSPGAIIAFTDVGNGDYHLATPDPQVVDMGCALATHVVRAANGRLQEYKAPQQSKRRPHRGDPDLGATEWHCGLTPDRDSVREEISKPEGVVAESEKVLPVAGEVFVVEGRQAFLIMPGQAATGDGTPWVWYAPTLRGLPGAEEEWMFQRFLDAGMAVAGIDVGESFGSPVGRAQYTALYEELVRTRGLSERPCLLARSRGGLMLYSWATEHPRSVACVAGIYPVCNLSSYPGVETACAAYGLTPQQLATHLAEHNPIDRLAPLAEAGVPLYHLHGDSDTVVPLEENSRELEQRYRTLGGTITLQVIKGRGHTMWPGWFQNQELVDFVVAHAWHDRPGVFRAPHSPPVRGAGPAGRPGPDRAPQ